MKGPETNSVGPSIVAAAIALRTARMSSSGAPRSRAPVTPACRSCFADAGMITERNCGG